MDTNKGPVSLLQTAADVHEELPTRIRALDALASAGDGSVTVELNKLLNRAKPKAVATKNWDPFAAERIVDLHIVEALSLLGDDSQLDLTDH